MTTEVKDHLPDGFRLLGPSTRPTTLTTGETIVFTREALENVVRNHVHRFVPQAVEHLGYLPPIGRVAEVALVDLQGDLFLAVRDEPLAPGTVPDLTLRQPDDAEGRSEGPPVAAELATEPRNFDDDAFAEINKTSPVDVGEIALHSELPPIVWSIVVSAGAVGFVGAKAFASEFFKKLGTESAEAFVTWIRQAARKAREGKRDQLVEMRFTLDNGLVVLAYCPFNPNTDASVEALREALNRVSDVAMFVNVAANNGVPEEVRHVAFVWDGAWRLGWYATETASFVTPWLEKHAPDPARFLGCTSPMIRLLAPYLPELPGAGASEAGVGQRIRSDAPEEES